MAKKFNRVRVACATTGTGVLALGAASPGYRTFLAAGAVNGDTVRYVIEDGTNWEIGEGTYNSGTLTRTVIESSNGNALLPLTGNSYVSCALAIQDLAEVLLALDGDTVKALLLTKLVEVMNVGDLVKIGDSDFVGQPTSQMVPADLTDFWTGTNNTKPIYSDLLKAAASDHALSLVDESGTKYADIDLSSASAGAKSVVKTLSATSAFKFRFASIPEGMVHRTQVVVYVTNGSAGAKTWDVADQSGGAKCRKHTLCPTSTLGTASGDMLKFVFDLWGTDKAALVGVYKVDWA